MSGNKGESSGGGAGQQGRECDNGCGYEPTNRRHEESYWEGRTDPRERCDDDKYMRFNSNYYKVVDRQIAADHAEHCKGSGAGGKQKK